MLCSLRVTNLAVVEQANVEFAGGLNVVTGETGAGKSILLGALDLVLGARADRSLIRSGAETCSVEAVFELHDTAAVDAVLEEAGMSPCEENRLLVRRELTVSGSGKTVVNGEASAVQTLRAIGDLLVDMHGPHDHQSLLNPDAQVDILDAFGHHAKPRAAYAAAYRTLLELDGRLRELEGDDRRVAEQMDLLSYQVQEIEDAALSDGDEDDLEQEHTTAANAQRILELAGSALHALAEDDASAFDALVQVQRDLGELAPLLTDAAPWLEEAESIAVQIQELADSIARAAGNVDADPSRLQFLEDRMSLLHRLKRKYGGSVAEILAFLEDARRRLHELETRSERIAELETARETARAEVMATGRKLRAARAKAAKVLAGAITSELRDLGFGHGAFDVDLAPRDPGPHGIDTVVFGFAPNVGEAMRPLRAIASSGEISRVMLATKAVLAAHDRIPVLVFDEIDANIGGETGSAVGRKLAAVAGTHQLLCITHLPQVAVHGNAHYVVEKSVAGGRTRTGIRRVDADARVGEVARMLGGEKLTTVTRRHAGEMLEKAQPDQGMRT